MFDSESQRLASEIAGLLTERNETVSIAESTTGGLISASLLSVPGASSFFLGGSIIYTGASRKAFLDLDLAKAKTLKPLSEDMAQLFADSAQRKLSATWGIAELGAAGPGDSPYGHPAGTSVCAVAGFSQASMTLQTGSVNRENNMKQFALVALELLLRTLEKN